MFEDKNKETSLPQLNHTPGYYYFPSLTLIYNAYPFKSHVVGWCQPQLGKLTTPNSATCYPFSLSAGQEKTVRVKEAFNGLNIQQLHRKRQLANVSLLHAVTDGGPGDI
jgi:hypothetical protein